MAATNLNFNTNICVPVANKTKYCKLVGNQILQQQNANNSLQKINTIFFDLDNTLIPTRSGDSKACRKVRNDVCKCVWKIPCNFLILYIIIVFIACCGVRSII